ncbi:hypothetical protein P691DRAFT_765406 [Macrolepiota fuliginosa MF-IS2]|uniref:Uncharacterized protein n=1 Tax=Macrolepiota fuliginosa MF-IS2 TaxID=1400762 RepID=A0A9P5X008_9AGAR|nr:hypothetical protein P691DRAFT_765406 [Macrolepiota fuliginosa MF-IS2]
MARLHLAGNSLSSDKRQLKEMKTFEDLESPIWKTRLSIQTRAGLHVRRELKNLEWIVSVGSVYVDGTSVDPAGSSTTRGRTIDEISHQFAELGNVLTTFLIVFPFYLLLGSLIMGQSHQFDMAAPCWLV